MANGIQDFSAPFFNRLDKSNQEINQRAAYAAQIAELAGGYTPELEAQVLAPLGQNPSIGENLLGAPIRGLGNLLGIESLQGVGAQVPFDLGQVPQQAPQMPPIPAGLDPDIRQAMMQIAESQGFLPGQERGTVSNVPSETSGRARLKTKTEREQEIRNQKQMWDFIMKNYQTQQDRQLAEAKIQQLQQSNLESAARIDEIRDRIKNGPPVTEARLIQKFLEENKDYDYLKLKKELAGLKQSKPAQQKLYEMVTKGPNPQFTGTFLEFVGAMERAEWNIVDAASELFYMNPLAPYRVKLEDHPQAIADIGTALGDAMDIIYDRDPKLQPAPDKDVQSDVTNGKTPIPAELEAQGVTDRDIDQLIETEMLEGNEITRAGAIKMYQEYLKNRGATNGTAGTAAAAE